ncbi:MAG: site-specific integrase [Acidobacteria bacterium]|nr:MAG: site-specific integrase [Acidobacteriota bacterium]
MPEVEGQYLTVQQLRARLNVSESYIYRRLKPSHPEYIPHKRLPSGDIRFDPSVADNILRQVGEENKVAALDSAVRGGIKMARRRDRSGSLRIKNGSWCVQWTEGKHRPSHVLGRVSDLTKSEARKRMREFMRKKNQSREVAGTSDTPTCFWKRFFYDAEKDELRTELKTKRASTRRDMKSVMKNVWLGRFGGRLLSSMGTAELQLHLDSMTQNHNTAAKYRAYLSTVFTSAIRLGAGLTLNPARFIKLPPEQPEQDYFMPSPEQVVAILEKLSKPVHKMGWRLVLWMGDRRGELRGLRWSSIYWEHDAILIRESVWEGQSSLPKTKKGYRKILLTAEQMEILRRYKEENFPDAQPQDWVLPGRRGRPMAMGWFMDKYVKPIAEKLGIPSIHWHAFRHLNNSIMLDEGVDVKTRMDRMGHVSDRVNMIYSHSADATQRKAAQAVWEKLKSAQARVQTEENTASLKVAGKVAKGSREEIGDELSY